MRHLAIVGAILLLAGCALPQRRVELLELQDGQALTFPADLRGAYFVNGRTCAEPAPDVSLASTSDLTATIKALTETGQSVEATAAANLAAKAVELSGRSQLVLLARELLYRGCEVSLNASTQDSEAALKLYNRVADLVERLGRADEDRAAARLAEAMKHSSALFGAKP